MISELTCKKCSILTQEPSYLHFRVGNSPQRHREHEVFFGYPSTHSQAVRVSRGSWRCNTSILTQEPSHLHFRGGFTTEAQRARSFFWECPGTRAFRRFDPREELLLPCRSWCSLCLRGEIFFLRDLIHCWDLHEKRVLK